MEREKMVTVDSSSAASNPGMVQVNYLHWFLNYPLWPIIWALSLVVFAVLTYMVHRGFGVPAFLLLLMNRFYWTRVREQFRYGCVNPGVVVSLRPLLIAVSTDLSKGVGEYPVVKIINKRLTSIAGQRPQIGTRVATVALYSQGTDSAKPHWIDFDPRPVDCATTNIAQITRVLHSIPAEEWQQLERWLPQVPKPYTPGLYMIQQEHGDDEQE